MANLRYITCCKFYKDEIVQRFRPAQRLENFFNKKEIEDLRTYQFQKARRVKFQETSSNIQSVCDMSQMFIDLPWLQYKFEELFGRGEFAQQHTGNYYITTQPHDAHIDLPTETEERHRWYDNLIPYKSVIIPLFLTHYTRAWTAFFKQRKIGYSVTFDRDHMSKQENSDYKIAREYKGLIDQLGNDCDPETDYDNWTHKKYPHISKNNLRGFEEEIVLEHQIGSIMLFDACQIHASVLWDEQPPTWMKNGINIQFYKHHDTTREF